MAKAMSKTYCRVVLLISFMMFFVSFCSAAEDETNASGRNDMKGMSE